MNSTALASALTALSQGNSLMEKGRPAEAAAAFRDAISAIGDSEPQVSGAAETNLGNALRMLRRTDEALVHCRRAVALAPDMAEAHHNLGAALLDAGAPGEAEAGLKRALALQPALIGARIDLARALLALGRRSDARAEADRAAATGPDGPLANLLGTIYLDLNEPATARALFERARASQPDDPEALNNLGNALTRLGEVEAALPLYGRALEHARDNPTYLANLGGARQAMGDVAGALRAFDRALMVDPGHADARWNRGIARLLTGDLAGGFADYESRWALPEFAERRIPSAAKWAGGAVAGLTIVVHAEQGFGDTIQMARFCAPLQRRGARVVLEVPGPLVRVMETLAGVDELVERGRPLPRADLHLPMMSFPRAFAIETLDDIPATVPYLRVRDDARIALPPRDERGMRVGIVWAGRPTHRNDRNRSMSLDAFAPLARIAGVRLYSLQVGESAGDLGRTAWGRDVVDLAPQLTDFAMTASAIADLDLVIAVDTAVAHLAGALGKPCWVLLPFAPDWRWLLERSDSPWYPTLRLFRQRMPGEWADVMDRVTAALRERVAGR